MASIWVIPGSRNTYTSPECHPNGHSKYGSARQTHLYLPQRPCRYAATKWKHPDPTPVQICDGQLADRHDFRTTHEDADVVIIQQAVHLTPTGINSIRVVADDTDVFVLLLYYYTTQQLTCNLVMTGTSYGRTSDNIKATAEKYSDIIPVGCTCSLRLTVAYLWGIGKVTVVK